jgi:glycosyltransferase involved in cell wall biosynthesis
MKLLFTNFHPYNGTGHDTYIYELATALSNYPQLSVSVAVPATSELFKKLSSAPKIKLIPMDFEGIKINKLKKNLQAVLALRRLLKAEKYDLVHVNGSPDHTLVMLARLLIRSAPKIIFTKHNSLPIKWGANLRYRYGTDAIIATSHSAKMLFNSALKIPIKIVKNGVDTELFKPADQEQILLLRKTYHLSPDTFVIGSVAGTAPYKGWHFLFQAVAQIRDSLPSHTKIIIAGMPPSADLIEIYVTKLHLTELVIFTGWSSDVTKTIPVFDIGFVLSYDIETISFACRQMMAMGKPVLVSNFAGLPENVTDGVDGWITQCRNIDDIKKCLLKIIDNREKLPSMSLNARQKALNEFSHTKWVADTLSVYEETLKTS